MDMDSANDGTRRERRQPPHRDRSWASPAGGAHPSGPKRPSHSRDRRGRHEVQSSWNVPSSSLVTQQPWRRGTGSTSTTSSTVPRPVVLPSMRSEGHPSPALFSDGGGERETSAEAGVKGWARNVGEERGASHECRDPLDSCNSATNVSSAPQTLVLDAVARRELERRIEEQLKASDIGVAWADVDEDDFDPNADPFPDKSQPLLTLQPVRSDEAEVIEGRVDEKHAEGAKATALHVGANKMDGGAVLRRGTLIDGDDPPRDKINRADKHNESASHAGLPLSAPPLPPSSSSFPSEALEALTLAAPVRGGEKTRTGHHRQEKARVSNSHSDSRPPTHTQVSPSPQKASQTTTRQTLPAPEMITRYIPVRLNADATEEVILVKLPLRNF